VAAALLMPSLGLPVRVAVVASIMILVTVLLGGVRRHDLSYLVAILRSDAQQRPAAGRCGEIGNS